MSELCKDSWTGKQDTSPRALQYLSNTYRCIARNIRHYETVPDSTVAAVMSMALHDDFRGQLSRSKVHIDALEHLIELRGGIATLEPNFIFAQKVCRADIEFALHDGSRPRFYRDEFPRKIFTMMLEPSNTWGNYTYPAAERCHRDIAHVYADIMAVSGLLNSDRACFKLEPDIYQEILISVCYRLLYSYPLAGKRPESNKECAIQLGLLALMTTMLFQHGRSQRLSYKLLAMLLRNIFLSPTGELLLEEKTRLWLLFIGGISVFEIKDRDWLVPRIKTSLRNLDVSSWDDALTEIKKFPWIDAFHHGPGQELWKVVIWE
ncbi:hypothetical protein P152DRAFT_389554 [Eremomyces bilateralis CBS 781.70]|uniref:Transcription factor domain-containing protein n=1 Tax=Eremomyces bilateralis CBS 781.70 TaxID=1392243 RepID=A0A6G1GEN6_9PEZI|nr:uncharacterized protein P152DRAFT_389554 [Eremomyces bilateralis CBS 781.70]KAF1816376.1 hypothetical protein P152DRAFT_389554 [Eremomyces bilateralis CBS 781.70]